ncbi:hypothetical protein B0I37DRAFT_448174 [Chaetomium sp. MPI-CAGE-AT-0009]|nr:hypothetical protein B0I37DRAFT_448174 [Chaetomium sp. MPI-CAGE-AT-0009]
MDLERNLPQTLVQQLNNEENIELFRAYCDANGETYSREVATTSLRYDKQRSELVPRRGQQATQNAIKCYVAEESIGVSPESCTWANVLDEMDKAKKEWDSKSKFRARHGGGIERNILPLLEAIPTDNGLGLLKGGLTVVFHAVKRRSDACERIFACFEEIPGMIAKGHTLARIHPDKPEVASKVEELHNSLFDSIPSLIDILLRRDGASSGPSEKRRGWKRATGKVVGVVKDLVRDAVKEVEGLIAPITAAVSKLEDCATMLSNAQVEVTGKRVAGLEVNVQLILDIIKPKSTEVSGKLDVIYSKVDEMSSRQDRISEEVSTLVNVLYRHFMESTRKRELESSTWPLSQGTILAALDHGRREFPSSQRQLEQPWPSSERLHDVDIDRLLEAIATDDEHLVFHQDRDRLVRTQSQFSFKALKNAYRIMESKELGIWMSSPESEFMVVDGGCVEQSKGVVSPMTVLCASIAAGLAANTASPNSRMEPAEAAVLFFACGEHTSPSRLLPGPLGMMRSLISQLLIARDLPWNPSRDRNGHVRYDRHPDLSFLAESATLWPEILQHRSTGAGSTTRQVPPVSRKQKRRRHDEADNSQSDSGSNSDSNSDSDSDSDDEYTTSQPPNPDPTTSSTHLTTLLTLFTTLIHQLAPTTTVYTILDGLSYYETAHPQWQAQLTHLTHRLATDLWLNDTSHPHPHKKRKGPKFKLLMTSPGRTRVLLDLVRRTYARDGALCVDLALGGSTGSGPAEVE